MYVYMCFNVLKFYVFYLSNCIKKRYVFEILNFLLFVVLNLSRGVNLYEI